MELSDKEVVMVLRQRLWKQKKGLVEFCVGWILVATVVVGILFCVFNDELEAMIRLAKGTAIMTASIVIFWPMALFYVTDSHIDKKAKEAAKVYLGKG